jgi:macrolide-specific efflux system membrane fusion protein
MLSNAEWVRSPRRLLAAAAVVAAGVLLVRGVTGNKRAAADQYRKVAVGRQDLSVTKSATGEVKPQNRVEVKPPIAGRIEQVLVKEGDPVTQGQVMAWMSSYERAALLDMARSQGPEAIAKWEAAYKPAPLMSPLNGTVIVRAVEPGQTVATDDPVVVVADRLIVKAQVDETDIGAIAVGQAASISLDAFPDDAVPAQVDHVAYEATTVNNVTIYEVDVLPDAVPDVMRSGMTATVTFTVAGKDGVLVVPADAVRQRQGGAEVSVPAAGPWGKPEPRTIEAGLTDGKWTEVVSGLQEGETVLVPSIRLPRGSGAQRSSPLTPNRGRRQSGNR